MAIIEDKTLALHDAIALPECRPALAAEQTGGQTRIEWRFPCGLSIASGVSDGIAGVFWGAISWAHERHHRECPQGIPWLMTETIETKHGSVLVTFGCSHGEVRQGVYHV